MENKTEIWKQASEIFADISEFSVKQAIAHLYGIKNITVEVREAVITLINAGSQASQYFDDNISPHYSFKSNNTQNFQVGQQLDEYELLEELGQGGMSQVFKAKRLTSDKQTLVAIKIFAPRHDSKELFKHFINEQKILSELSHPHIVRMLHDGITDDDTAYLVMELIEDAQPLDAYCQVNKLATKKKIKIIAQCADALAYSHANLIIHRDLKPDNILINKNHKLKIIDFGIAKLINQDISGNKTTIMALTPSYAAPEQINSQQITVKTDIFSLAVVALDLLIEKDPLPKDRLLKSCANDEAHLDKIFKSLNCDKDLKNILRKALEQEPNKRYSSMQSFADDLNDYLSNKPVSATSQSFIYRVQKFAKRRSALFATMVSFVAFLIIGSVLGYQQYKQIKIEAGKANQVKQFMLDAFNLTNPNKTKGAQILATSLLQAYSQKMYSDNSLDPKVRFELLQTLGIAYGALGEPNQAINSIKRSLEIHPNDIHSISYLAEFLSDSRKDDELDTLLGTIDFSHNQSKSDMARIYRIMAKQSTNKGDFNQAHLHIDKAIELNVNPLNKDEQIMSVRVLAQIYDNESKTKEGIIVINNLLSKNTHDINNTYMLGIRADLATMYDTLGSYDLSIEEWQKIIKNQRKILGDSHPDLAISLSNLSATYKHMGDMEASYSAINEAVAITKIVYGMNNIITANILNTQAMLLYRDGKEQEAIDLTYKVIDIYENQKQINHVELDTVKVNQAISLMTSGKHQEAYDLAKPVYDYQVAHLGFTHDETTYTQQILARILSSLKRTEEAIALAKLSVANIEKEGEKTSNLKIAGAYYTLARIYQEDEQHHLAIDAYRQTVDRKLLNEDEYNYAVLVFSLAKLYELTNNFDSANKYYIEAIDKHIKIFTANHSRTLYAQLNYAIFLKSNNKIKESLALFKKIDTAVSDHKIKNKRVLDLLVEFKE